MLKIENLHCLVYILCVCLSKCAVFGQTNSYRAAALEYAPHTEAATFTENWQNNLREYLQYIQDASNQRAQIVVFPEYGLSGWNPGYSDIDVSSTEVPAPNLHVLPCTAYYDNYSSTLRELSCAARNHKLYVVVNLIEKVTDHDKSNKVFYNTNVVFNRHGEIIARHRKMNMYKEPYFAAGHDLTTFTTDFGVTFGMFICADIVFKNPALETLLKFNNVTDVIFSTAWFSELPFSQSTSIQHGYAKANGVNLLASNLNDPKESNGGSGIYLADGRVAETFTSGTKLSKLLVQDIPKISSRLPNTSCKFQKSSGSYKWGVDPFTGNISSFHTTKQDLHDYTFKNLNLLGLRNLSETICSSTSSFCCTFNIKISRTNSIPPNYIYKLAAFQGSYPNTNTITIGLRHCAIVACTGENNESCGERNGAAPRGIRFEEISISSTLDGDESHYEPDTVTYDMKPVTDYTFCVEEKENNKLHVTMSTTGESIESLLTFGLRGRVYKYDHQPVGPINFSGINSSSTIIIILSVCTLLLVYVS